MPIKHIIIAIVIGIGLLSLIIELIRRRRLLEEYAILWILTGIILLVFALKIDLLLIVARFLDIKTPAFTLLLFGFLFLVLVCLQFSIKLSAHTQKIKNIAQELSLLKHQLGAKSGKDNDK